MSNIVPIQGRPLTGVYPSCPPPCPPFSGLEECYAQVKQAQDFLKQMLIDIINCDPSIIGRGTPIVGVTDGTDAQPGMVGEWVMYTASVPFTATAQTQVVSMGSLSAGDWDCWAYAIPNVFTTDVLIILNPQPAGFTGNMWSKIASATILTGVSIVTPQVRALTSVPSLIAFTVITNDSGDGPSAGTLTLEFMARRRR